MLSALPIKRLALVLGAALTLAIAPVTSANATVVDLSDLVGNLMEPTSSMTASAPSEVADDICVLPEPRQAVCLEVQAQVVPDVQRPWRTTVAAYARVCVHDGWYGIFNPRYVGGEVACGYTTNDWGYVSGRGACVTVSGLAEPAACANGQDECVLVLMNANRVLCD